MIPAGDRFCWVTISEEKPEPLQLEEVDEVVDVADQVHEDVVEQVHEDHGADAVVDTGIEDDSLAGSRSREETAEAGSEDEWLRSLSRAEENCEEEEQGEPSRWITEEILGQSARKPTENQTLFEVEDVGLDGYELPGEREVFFQGGDWSYDEVEAEEMNQVSVADESGWPVESGDERYQAGGEEEGWTLVTRRRRKQSSKDSLEAEKVKVKAEKKSAKGKNTVIATQEARKNVVKSERKTFKAEAEKGRGTRAKAVPPPKKLEPMRN